MIENIIDNHVHIGWFQDGFHSPTEILKELRNASVKKAIVSSTSTCAELYHNVENEIKELIEIASELKIYPILWLSPKMIKNYNILSKMLSCGINWKGVKLHYVSHPDFFFDKALVKIALDLARNLNNVPVLIHTGEWETCHAGIFESIISENPDLNFILAHGRPISETVYLIKKYPNVWTDNAFMPFKDLKKLKKED